MIIWIHEKFPNLNDYINAERRHRMIAAKMKKEWTEKVFQAAAMVGESVDEQEFPTSVHFIIHEANKRRDVDNIGAFVAKVGLDGMVMAGVIPNDSQKYIRKIECDVVVDGYVGVEIII